jgi:hypothetical protein
MRQHIIETNSAATHALVIEGYNLEPTKIEFVYRIYKNGEPLGCVETRQKLYKRKGGTKWHSYAGKPIGDVIAAAMANKRYSLHYYIGARVYEIVLTNKTYAQCLAKKQAIISRYRMGKLIIEPHGSDNN